jgi:hypothetical protein
MDEHTARVRQHIAENAELATEISQVLAKYDLGVPDGMTVVWTPIVEAKPETILEAYFQLKMGVPKPDFLKAAHAFQQRFAVKQFQVK